MNQPIHTQRKFALTRPSVVTLVAIGAAFLISGTSAFVGLLLMGIGGAKALSIWGNPQGRRRRGGFSQHTSTGEHHSTDNQQWILRRGVDKAWEGIQVYCKELARRGADSVLVTEVQQTAKAIMSSTALANQAAALRKFRLSLPSLHSGASQAKRGSLGSRLAEEIEILRAGTIEVEAVL